MTSSFKKGITVSTERSFDAIVPRLRGRDGFFEKGPLASGRVREARAIDTKGDG